MPTKRALGSLPSVALSSGRINVKYMIKWVLQVCFNEINLLGNSEPGILIVVDHLKSS
jgi:hypothetical protein